MMSENDHFLLFIKTKPCVGCGYCCSQAPCFIARIKHPDWTSPCPELIKRDGRFWCGAVERMKGDDREQVEEDLAIGAGCSSTMFNEVRDAQIAKMERARNAEEED